MFWALGLNAWSGRHLLRSDPGSALIPAQLIQLLNERSRIQTRAEGWDLEAPLNVLDDVTGRNIGLPCGFALAEGVMELTKREVSPPQLRRVADALGNRECLPERSFRVIPLAARGSDLAREPPSPHEIPPRVRAGRPLQALVDEPPRRLVTLPEISELATLGVMASPSCATRELNRRGRGPIRVAAAC
jgi:hypothetical protein